MTVSDVRSQAAILLFWITACGVLGERNENNACFFDVRGALVFVV